MRRFLHELEQVESFANLRLRQLRSYVYAQLPTEIAQALGCSLATAEHLVNTALTSTHPVALPRPRVFSVPPQLKRGLAPFLPLLARAVCATIHSPICLYAVTEDSTTTMAAGGSKRLNGALKAIEGI